MVIDFWEGRVILADFFCHSKGRLLLHHASCICKTIIWNVIDCKKPCDSFQMFLYYVIFPKALDKWAVVESYCWRVTFNLQGFHKIVNEQFTRPYYQPKYWWPTCENAMTLVNVGNCYNKVFDRINLASPSACMWRTPA